jgi:hypothetical protein
VQRMSAQLVWSTRLSSELSYQRKLRRVLVAIAIIGPVTLAPEVSSAESLLDFFFGGRQEQKPQMSFFDKVFDTTVQPSSAGQPIDKLRPGFSSGPGFCVRSCDGKYFPLTRGTASPTQMCEAFCPASATEVFFGSTINTAYSESGKLYGDSENAFAYRKALRADCTCNGRTPAGLAAIDLALDNTLRKGDVVATTDGLVAYTGIGVNDPIPEFAPVSSFPGLAPQMRAERHKGRAGASRYGGKQGVNFRGEPHAASGGSSIRIPTGQVRFMPTDEREGLPPVALPRLFQNPAAFPG